MLSESIRIGYLCLLVVVFAAVTSADDDDEHGGRIVGGQVTNIGMVPYAIQLRDADSGKVFCGGTLVTRRHVVTAAHCLDEVHRDDMIAVGGATTDSEQGQQRKIVRAIKHPGYNKKVKNSFDVAVLMLKSFMTGPNTHTIPLATRRVDPGEKLLISGWGRTSERALEGSHKLQTATVSLFKNDDCIEKYGKARISESMMCASQPGTQDSCTGDSGGAAVVNKELVGIVSFGDGCGRADSPGVYTDVYQVKDFIKSCLKL